MSEEKKKIKGLHNVPDLIKHLPFYSYLWNVTHRRNANFILSVIGLGGRGKSYAALKIMWDLMLTYEGERKMTPENCLDNITFSFEEFAKRVEANNKRGAVIMWEEVTSIDSANARRFYEDEAVHRISLFHTMRFKNQICIMTMPVNSFIDKQMRGIVHGQLMIQNHNDYFSWGKLKLNQLNPEMNEVYKKYLRYHTKKGLVKADEAWFPLPPKWLCEKYEEKQQDYKRRLQARINEYIEKRKLEKGLASKSKLRVVLDLCKVRWRDFYDSKTGKFVPEMVMDDDEVRDLTDVSLSYAKSIAKTLQIRKDKGTLY